MRRFTTEVLPPVLTIALILLLWQYGAWMLNLPSYLVPTPLDVGAALNRGLVGGSLWPHIAATVQAMLGGFFLGCPLGIIAASLLAESRMLERCFYPVFVALQSIPKVALAPIIIVWVGFGISSKVILVALMCFFPTFINTFSGLKSYNADLADMFKVFGASRWRTFFRIKLPSATRHIFAGLQISAVMAMLGTVLSEMIAAQRGLGYVIQNSSLTFDIPMMFACAAILAVIGVAVTRGFLVLQRELVFWERDAEIPTT